MNTRGQLRYFSGQKEWPVLQVKVRTVLGPSGLWLRVVGLAGRDLSTMPEAAATGVGYISDSCTALGLIQAQKSMTHRIRRPASWLRQCQPVDAEVQRSAKVLRESTAWSTARQDPPPAPGLQRWSFGGLQRGSGGASVGHFAPPGTDVADPLGTAESQQVPPYEPGGWGTIS